MFLQKMILSVHDDVEPSGSVFLLPRFYVTEIVGLVTIYGLVFTLLSTWSVAHTLAQEAMNKHLPSRWCLVLGWAESSEIKT